MVITVIFVNKNKLTIINIKINLTCGIHFGRENVFNKNINNTKEK